MGNNLRDNRELSSDGVPGDSLQSGLIVTGKDHDWFLLSAWHPFKWPQGRAAPDSAVHVHRVPVVINPNLSNRYNIVVPIEVAPR